MKNKIKKTHKIFIAGTRQNDGKTTISLGLIRALRRKFKRVSFIKPVGQRYVFEEGYKVDEDSVLIDKVFDMKGSSIKDMSPVAIEKGFTSEFIKRGNRRQLVDKILNSFEQVSKKKDLVVVEGTGHAGVGSVFDLSNARVANLLGSKVILVTAGGIGRPLDEIELNMALFEKEGVDVIGVIVNKVRKDKYKKVKRIINIALKKRGIDLLGVIPYTSILSMPLVQHILEERNFALISKKVGMSNKIKNIIIGAMEPHDALSYIKDGSLLITPGDREDMLMTVLSAHLLKKPKKNVFISGIVLTGGIVPNKNIMMLIEQAKIPVFLTKDHTYKAASKLHDIAVKIGPKDRDKTKLAEDLVKRYVDIEKIVEKIKI